MRSPFKFLDSYGADDAAVFFGRTAEVEALYKLTFETGLILLYGASGTGKTSVISCGLANRFDASDWLEVPVRRRADLNASLVEAIHARAKTPIESGEPLTNMVQSLYLDYFRPIFLIFDQFEELFILGSDEERAKFVADLAELLASNVNCKVIISIREEYIALLQSFEREIPTLFDHRLRIEAMGASRVAQIVVKMCAAYNIELQHGEATAASIVARLGTGRAIQLTYLQVYLDRLWRKAAAEGDPIVFDDALVDDAGQMADIMGQFLDEQIATIQHAIGSSEIEPLAVRHLLEEFATLEGTKEPLVPQDIHARRPEAPEWIDRCLMLLEQSRILREVDGLYELAHDSLAGQIAERRSDDRKAVLRIEKIVRDRLFAFDQTGTYLSNDEVAFVNRASEDVRFTETERAFLAASADHNRANEALRLEEIRIQEKREKENQLLKGLENRMKIFQIVIAAISIIFFGLGSYDFEKRIGDLIIRYTNNNYDEDKRIVLMKITNETISSVGEGGLLPRENLAEALKSIDSMGAKKIAVDVLIDWPASGDNELRDAIEHINTPIYFYKFDDKEVFDDNFGKIEYNKMFFENPKKRNSSLNLVYDPIIPDSDSVVRRWPSTQGRKYMAEQLAGLKAESGVAIDFRDSRFSDLPVFSSVPIDLFLNKDFDKDVAGFLGDLVRGKIVIIGYDKPEMNISVPNGRTMSTPEVIAHMTAQALDKSWTTQLQEWAIWLMKFVLVAAGALTALVGDRKVRVIFSVVQIMLIISLPFLLIHASYDILNLPMVSLFMLWISSYILVRALRSYRYMKSV